jgi:hypothetical protein
VLWQQNLKDFEYAISPSSSFHKRFLPSQEPKPQLSFWPTKQQRTWANTQTVEGAVAKVFTRKAGNTFLNIGATYSNQTFTGWIPPTSPVNKSPMLSGIEGKHVKITGRIEMYKGKPEIQINAASHVAFTKGHFFSNFGRPSHRKRVIRIH